MRNFFLFYLIFFLSGCINDKKIPNDIISQNEMKKILWDLMRADAYVSDFVTKDSSKNQKEESLYLYESIFKIHSTSREIFEKSLVFYEGRPDLFKPITDSLKALENRVVENNNNEPAIQKDTTLEKLKFNKKLQ